MLNKKRNTIYWIIGLTAIVVLLGSYFLLNPSSESSDTTSNQNFVESVKGYSLEEISLHSVQEDCWVIVNNKVYDVTEIIPTHPGGIQAIASNCGKEASTVFNTKNGKGTHSPKAHSILETHLLGNLTN